MKCENFQRAGAFKFRGAFNAVALLSPEERSRGVVTFSSGNHAQALALVGSLQGVETTVVMPDNAPEIKKRATRGYGAQVIEYDPEQTAREEVAARIAEEKGFVIVPPYDHENIAAGQGTAALELIEDVGPLDMLLTPCGGGGLLSGTAAAAKGLAPDCRVIGVEPELADDAFKSFKTRVLHTVRNPPTIADGVRTPSLGRVTFPLILEYVDDMALVSEEAIKEAVRFLFYRLKIVVEPTGGLGLAALLSGSVPAQGRIGVILSGGNVDGPTMAGILEESGG